jgi:hypothetical protein
MWTFRVGIWSVSFVPGRPYEAQLFAEEMSHHPPAVHTPAEGMSENS